MDMSASTSPLILIVDDEPGIRTVLCDYLSHAGYRTVWASNGNDALKLFADHSPDLVLLDLMLPGLNGEQVLKNIRQKGNTPVILLTALGAEDERLRGFGLGADDYVTKPFSPREIVARVASLLRRSFYCDLPKGSGLTLDKNTSSAFFNGKNLGLTIREFRILEALVHAGGRTLSREQIIAAAFSECFGGYDRTIDSHIKNLRQKLEQDSAHPVHILTVRGMGYRFQG